MIDCDICLNVIAGTIDDPICLTPVGGETVCTSCFRQLTKREPALDEQQIVGSDS